MWKIGLRICIVSACMLALGCQPARAAVTRTGTLQATVSDDFRNGRAVVQYRLESGRGATAVRPTELDAEPGDRVAVTGELRDGRLVGAVEATGASAGAAELAAGPRETAVLLFTFAGEGGEPWSPAVARSEVFTGANSVNAFYDEESYGEISLTGKLDPEGDVFGWLETDASPAGCADQAWREAADEAAAGAGIDLSGYRHVIYEFPYQGSCSWLGRASVGGSWSMINGDFLGLGLRRRVTVHELGHNLGLLHAGSWTCTAGGVRVQISDTCTAAEYGDPFDAMGNRAIRHNNGWNLAKLDILTAENVETVESSGSYGLRSALTPTTQPTVLRIPRERQGNGEIDSWYYLEIRRQGGVFENVSDASTAGVSIRATNEGASPETLLLDAHPETAGFADAPLGAGEAFDGGPVQITTVSAGGGSATVSVGLDEEPPTAPADLIATAGAEEVQLQWSASDDNVGVERYVVSRDGAEVGVAASTDLLDSPVALGEHEYVVYAEDETGNRSAASEPAEVTVVPDEEPPTAPTGLTATVGDEGVQLQWGASSDEFGVERYFVFRGDVQVGTPKSTGFLDSAVSAGEHTYLVYAEDKTGNRSEASDPATATVPAIAGPVCAAGTCTVVYRHSGEALTWTVPPGVAAAQFTVEGAQGGTDLLEPFFGRGARVVATLGSLTPGEEATVSVAGAGERDGEGGEGGFNGGGDGTLGAGGFSSVELESTLMLLAAGGGGDGRDGFNSVTENEPNGGRGGRGGELGTPGSLGVSTEAHGATLGKGGGGASGGSGGGGGSGGVVAGAGTCPGGAGGGPAGAPGSSLAGGGGASGAGGGGGGGYLGGGQGGGPAADECGSAAGAGAGGGGSSFAAAGLSPTFKGGIRRGDGEISIAYPNPIGAAAHSYATEPDLELTVPAGSGVLTGAALPAGSLTASSFSEPAHGELTLHADGSFAYAPAPGYAGEDSFAYRAEDAAGDYETATATLTIEPPPEPEEPGPSSGPPEPQVPAPPAPEPVVGLPTPLPAPLAVAIRSPRTRLAHRVAKLKLACRGGAPGGVCRGVLRLSTGPSLLARRRYALAGGRARWVSVRLRPAPLRRLLRRRSGASRVRATATVVRGRNARRAIVLRFGSARRHLHTRGGAGSPVRK